MNTIKQEYNEKLITAPWRPPVYIFAEHTENNLLNLVEVDEIRIEANFSDFQPLYNFLNDDEEELDYDDVYLDAQMFENCIFGSLQQSLFDQSEIENQTLDPDKHEILLAFEFIDSQTIRYTLKFYTRENVQNPEANKTIFNFIKCYRKYLEKEFEEDLFHLYYEDETNNNLDHDTFGEFGVKLQVLNSAKFLSWQSIWQSDKEDPEEIEYTVKWVFNGVELSDDVIVNTLDHVKVFLQYHDLKKYKQLPLFTPDLQKAEEKHKRYMKENFDGVDYKDRKPSYIHGEVSDEYLKLRRAVDIQESYEAELQGALEDLHVTFFPINEFAKSLKLNEWDDADANAERFVYILKKNNN